jgi:cytochrome P450
MIEYLGLVLASAVLLIYLLKLRFSRNDYFWEKLGFPTVKTKLTLYDLVFKGTFPFDIDRVYYKELGDEKFGGIVELGVPVLLIKDLDLARNIFVKDFESFFDRRDFGRSDKILSESLFFLQGAKWKGMRAFLSPTFTSGKIRRMFHHMETTSQDMTKYIVEQCPKDKGGHVVVVQELMRKFAVEVIGTSVFGMQTNVFKDPNAVFFKFAMKTAEFDVPRKIRVSIIQSFPRIAEWLELKFLDNQAHEFLRRALADSLKVRESSSEQRDDFIQLLVEAMRGDNKIDESESSDLVNDSLIKGLVGKQKLTLTENMAIGQGFLFFFAG